MTLPPLPEPDTHCFDDDVGKDVWSHSPEQLHAYGEACAAANEPQGEPVATLHDDGYWTPKQSEAGRRLNDQLMHAGTRVDVYTHPPLQCQPLTKVQITELAEQCGYDGAVPTVRLAFQGFKLDDFARAIEAAHGIKETP